MRKLLLGILATALAAAGCGKGDQPKPLGAASSYNENTSSQKGTPEGPGAGATGPGATGEGGGSTGPERTSANPGGGTPTGSD